jgi:hypothetical protein
MEASGVTRASVHNQMEISMSHSESEGPRVKGIRIKNVAVEVWPNVKNLMSHIADGVAVCVRKEGDWRSRLRSPVHSDIREVAGNFFHDRLKEEGELKPLQTALVHRTDAQKGLSNVLFVNGTRPVGRALESLILGADDEGWETLVLPMAAIADTESDQSNADLLLEIASEIGTVLDTYDLANIIRIKVIQPHQQDEISTAVAYAIAGAAQSAARRKATPVKFESTLQRSNIATVEGEALIACVSSDGSGDRFAITADLHALAGDHFHKQLAGKGKVDGLTFRVNGSSEFNAAFGGVIFVVNDGKKTVAQYIEKALRFADSSGLRSVVLPLHSFVADKNADDHAYGAVIDQAVEGIKNFLGAGNHALQNVSMVMPLGEGE